MKMLIFSTTLGLSGLFYIAFVTLTRSDAIYLIKLNILIPFIIITLSLSSLSFGIKQTLLTTQYMGRLMIFNTPLTSKQITTLRGLRHYCYLSTAIWIAYSAALTFSFEHYSPSRLYSFSAIAILYALIAELIISTCIRKSDYLKNKD